jgi:pimeloyl-ACP methyl ester carboxylesterase
MRILLIHGLGRSPLSMMGLVNHLRRAGNETESVGYVAAVESFERIRMRVRSRLIALAGRSEPFAVVGHSLGGLLACSALAGWPAVLPLPSVLVTLGSPLRPPRLAVRLRRTWWYRLATGDCGQRLGDARFFEALPMPPVRWLRIAGTAGWRGKLSPFQAHVNDGLVALDEVTLDGRLETLRVDASHTFVMNHRRARRTIDRLLAEPGSAS